MRTSAKGNYIRTSDLFEIVGHQGSYRSTGVGGGITGQGADILIIKPGLAYMDILKMASQETDMPLATYNVSGEYSMVKAAAANGWIDEKRIVMENMIGFKRAGAQMIITYHALDVAKWIKEGY